MSDVHKGHRMRVKTEFRDKGLDHFPHHRIMEMLLYYSIRRGDTNELGHMLVEKFGSISSIFDADYQLLKEVPGLGEESATLIKFISSIIRVYMDDHVSLHNVITDSNTAKKYMQYKFLCEPKECIFLACMGSNGKVIYCDKIAEGSPEKVSISPAKVVKAALRANAVRAVLSHNHPNGICIPSNKDLQTTSILFDELRRVDVELFDHIIVAPDGVYSMVENNMFPRNRNMLL